jgi:hypothetical protein
MADYLALDVAELERQIDNLIISYPELAEDEELRAGMIDGETNLLTIVNRIVGHKLDADTMVGQIKQRQSDLSERKARFERRSEAMKTLLKNILSRANLDKIVTPEATVSITRPRESVSIIDIEALPQGFYKTERVADKVAIGNALKTGEDVPGAGLCYGEAGISVRPK